MKRTKYSAFAVIAGCLLCSTTWAQQLRADPWVSGFSTPVAMIQDPAQTDVQYVVEQGGTIRVIQNGVVRANAFLNISSRLTSGGERGLLGLAFAPDYATSGFFYVNYTDLAGDTQVSRFTRSVADPFVADSTSERKIIHVDQPFSNHNGGTLRFGPDGYLYIGMGDGGSGNDPLNNAQNPNVLLGKMLRIDPSSDDFPADPNRNYHIPADNPFLDGVPINAAGEIWDIGLRNPWKFSFDSPTLGGTGALIIADVGQGTWEEIDYEGPAAGGRNYGWRIREGAHSNITGTPAFTPMIDPIHEYNHSVGQSLTGGYVYRGADLGAGFLNRYFFADYVAGKVWSFLLTQGGGSGSASGLVEHTTDLGAVGNISSIDIDSGGEIYLLRHNSPGIIYRLRPYTAPSATLPAAAFSIVRGVLISGGIGDLASSNDSRLIVRNGIVSSSSDSPVTVEFTATAPNQTTGSMSIRIENQVSIGNLNQFIDVFDWVSNSYVSLDSRTATINSDQSRLVPIPNPNRCIQSGTRAIKARLRVRANGPTSVSQWQSRIDFVSWMFWP